MELEVRSASKPELGDFLSVMDEAAEWLHARGITEQWPASFSGHPEWPEPFASSSGGALVFLARRSGEAVACVVLQESPFQHEAGRLWPDGAPDAVFLSKLAIRRSVAGQDVAARLLRWAAEHTRGRGKTELRLDRWAGNERLKRYYAEAGFEPLGDVELHLGEMGRRGRILAAASRCASRQTPGPAVSGWRSVDRR